MGGKRKHHSAEQKTDSNPKGKGKSYSKRQDDTNDGGFRFSNMSASYILAVVVIGEYTTGSVLFVPWSRLTWRPGTR